jgi:proton-translocating NADH-quinone oxidoreductase chain M
MEWLTLGTDSLLLPVMLLPLLGCVGIGLFVPSSDRKTLFSLSFGISMVTFVLSLFLWVTFDASSQHFQHVCVLPWFPMFYQTHMQIVLGVDGISVFFVLLTTFLIPFCILLGNQAITHSVKEYCMAFLLLEFCTLGVFCVLDVLLFYVFFESVLLPMFFIVGVFGSRERRIRAAYQFFLYTLIGSLLMLVAILVVSFECGTSDYQVLLSQSVSERKQLLLWFAFFCSFAVKVPMIPVHIWLPEAHVEAPTSGSVILAGVMLKLGTYGFLRFSIPLFPAGTVYFTPLMLLLSLIGIMYASATTVRQVDLKKIIAYSSVAHMGYVILGLFSLNMQGVEGSILLMISHGFVSSALFVCVGIVYDRFKTRLVGYYGGLVYVMPVYAVFFLLFTLGNLGLPGTMSFCGEFMVLLGTWQVNSFVCFLACSGMVLGGAYSLWLYNRVVFGHMKSYGMDTYCDVTRREFFILLPFAVCMIWLGIYPTVILEDMHCSVHMILENVYSLS